MQIEERPALELTPPEPEKEEKSPPLEPPRIEDESQISFWEDLLGSRVEIFQC